MNGQHHNAKSEHGDHAANADDSLHMQQAARRLDAEADALDAATLAALARARREASRRRHGASWFGWRSAGLGVALAAALTAVLVMPAGEPGRTPPADAALAQLAAIDAEDFRELALTDDSESALAEDLAFIAWLEENHDAG